MAPPGFEPVFVLEDCGTKAISLIEPGLQDPEECFQAIGSWLMHTLTDMQSLSRDHALEPCIHMVAEFKSHKEIAEIEIRSLLAGE